MNFNNHLLFKNNTSKKIMHFLIPLKNYIFKCNKFSHALFSTSNGIISIPFVFKCFFLFVSLFRELIKQLYAISFCYEQISVVFLVCTSLRKISILCYMMSGEVVKYAILELFIRPQTPITFTTKFSISILSLRVDTINKSGNRTFPQFGGEKNEPKPKNAY